MARAQNAPQETATEETAEVVPYDPRDEVIPSSITAGLPSLADDQLRRLQTFDEAMRLAAEQYGDVQDYAETYGTGFHVVDKSKLVDVPFLVLQFRVHDGKWKGGFMAAHVITEKNEKFIITDGSTGLYKQLAEVAAGQSRNGGFLVKGGLRVSVYDTCLDCGKPRTKSEAVCENCGDGSEARAEGRTYYLNA